jgi:6-phosphogluconolactonase
VLLAARDVSFLIEGKDKATVLKEVLLGPYDPEVHPSQLIRPENGKLMLLLDGAAASGLPASGADGWGRLELGE